MSSAFATAADLQLLDPSLSDEVAHLVLTMVSDGIRAGLGWQVDEFTETRTFYPEAASGSTSSLASLPVDPIQTIVLPGRNVRDVVVTLAATVALIDESGAADGTELVEGTDYRVDQAAGIVKLTEPTWETVTVEYTAGWTPATLPGAFRTVALEWGAQYAANPGNVRQYTMGKVQETFASNSSSSLVIEDGRLDRYSLGAV